MLIRDVVIYKRERFPVPVKAYDTSSAIHPINT